LDTAADLASLFHGTSRVRTDDTPTYALRQITNVDTMATGTCFVGLLDSSPDVAIVSKPTNA